ncbi:hypothetical protein PR202_ga22767 [Eleusine coracana subsp. coracana]|uniref:Uncharacterized protein n=1 Tax=Eleusine coracana subsp. coracana TaxID=191504 RepID=A0AAV5D2J9_ELECO|nr:hypothetical protein PR202_ga22767 [Eleusine coracana subsp. coracana]
MAAKSTPKWRQLAETWSNDDEKFRIKYLCVEDHYAHPIEMFLSAGDDVSMASFELDEGRETLRWGRLICSDRRRGGGARARPSSRNGVGGEEKKGEEVQLKMEIKADAKIGGGIGFGMVGPTG